ncbi:RagB/SusD family nutrient uptake outer membrane protein [Roseivirga sp. BDSF3-8]|uniref:RagB/SusD family nutrient uptake outer membrane protein n=1 Tax=Roseivirga sp. BDSF3-8 TaxID=3241598 RepID=UPI003531A2FD
MKKWFLYIFLGTAATCTVSSCGEDFLEQDPLVQQTASNFFETEEQAIEATNAVYFMLRDWSVHVFSYIGLTDIHSDDAVKGSTPNDAAFLRELDDYTYDQFNIAFGGVWSGYYRGIRRANEVIDKVPRANINDDLGQRLVGEAKFLRAYFYFFLVRGFGGVPLLTGPTISAEGITRATEAQVLDQIEQDLIDAAAVLPEKSEYPSTELGRATRGAALGFLAKVYLWRDNYDDALTTAEQVINSGEYSLAPDFAMIFRVAGEHGSGSIFEVSATSSQVGHGQGGGGSQFNQVQGVRGNPNLGWGFNWPSPELEASFDPQDPRRDATILYVGEELPDGSAVIVDNPNLEGERYNQKAWVSEQINQGAAEGNIRLLRLADILLVAAEAANELNQTGKAQMYLNMVRQRARGGDMDILPDVTTSDQAQLRTAIWNERRWELAMEQQRWFDLKSQGRLEEAMRAVGKTNFDPTRHIYWPIPQQEVDLTGGDLSQNDGWN